MKIRYCLIIALSLVLSNHELVLALDNIFGNITALTYWSDEIFTNIWLIILLQVNNKLVPEIPKPTIVIDRMVNAKDCLLLQRLPVMRHLDKALGNLAMNLDVIDRFYRDFNIFVKNEGEIKNVAVKRWVTSITSDAIGNLPDTLWKIHRSIVSEYNFNEGLFMLMSRTLQENDNDICDIGVSPQYCLYTVYQDVMVREIKAYIMTLYAYGYLRYFENGDFRTQMKVAKDEFNVISGKLLRAVFESMKQVPREMSRCDPRKHQRNSTFLELERLMQSYIVHKVNINRRHRCDVACSQSGDAMLKDDDYYGGFYRPNRACDGNLISCTDGGQYLRLCELPNDNPRRYEWLQNQENVYGVQTDCNDGTITRFQGWTSEFGADCHFCICTCMQDKFSQDSKIIRTISFMNQMSNITQNMVVVGLKFISKFGVIHVQILQAPLLEQGRIDIEKLMWVPIKEFNYLQAESKESDEDRYSIRTDDNERTEPGEQYGSINRYQRQMNLDDILLPDDYIVTGVRFRRSQRHGQLEDQSIGLEVHGTPFDYTYGKLVPMKNRGSMWFTAEDMRNEYYGGSRQELRINSPGNPLNYVNHVPNSKPNSYIMFTKTDLNKDAGQATVPFFDALEVGGKTNSPLSGIGIFHRGHSTSGGFLAFRVYGMNLTKYMTVPNEDSVKSFDMKNKY